MPSTYEEINQSSTMYYHERQVPDPPIQQRQFISTPPSVRLVSEPPPIQLVSTPPPIQLVSNPPPIQLVSSPQPVHLVSSLLPAQFVSSHQPVSCVCPFCHQSIVTRTEKINGGLVWAASVSICLLGFVIGCCLIPFFVDGLKDTKHYCPICNRMIGRKKRI